MRRWLLLMLLAWPGAASAEEEETPKPPLDAHARPGDPIVYEAPPATKGPKACSFRTPVCVHFANKSSAAVLLAADRAWETLSQSLGVPAPDPDPSTLAFDVWGAPTPEVAAAHLSARDTRSRIDRGRSFVTVDPAARPGCALDIAVTRAVARAFMSWHAPAIDEATARAQTAYLTNLIVPCASAFTADEAYAFQSRPDRCVASAGDELFSNGAALFWSRIDWAFAAEPGGIVTATWALAPTKTESLTVWRNQPDPFDVLRDSFKNTLHSGSIVDDLFLDVAVARAFMGANDDGEHQPETRTLGALAKVPYDWDIAWPDKPRRLTQRLPAEPTGASYISIRAKPGARLRAEIAWEEHAIFRWAFVKVDAAGRELGRVVIPSRERATETAMTLVDLGASDHVLLVGVNAGDPAYRFDPDDAVWEPHGWLVTIAAVDD